jgi:hypothetical protein
MNGKSCVLPCEHFGFGWGCLKFVCVKKIIFVMWPVNSTVSYERSKHSEEQTEFEFDVNILVVPHRERNALPSGR